MSGTGMPRGMLRGCQRRVAILEKHGICFTLIRAGARAHVIFLATIFVLTANSFRKKEWWENIH